MTLPHGAVVSLQCVIVVFPDHTNFLVAYVLNPTFHMSTFVGSIFSDYQVLRVRLIELAGIPTCSSIYKNNNMKMSCFCVGISFQHRLTLILPRLEIYILKQYRSRSAGSWWKPADQDQYCFLSVFEFTVMV